VKRSRTRRLRRWSVDVHESGVIVASSGLHWTRLGARHMGHRLAKARYG
jgi:hypothetical protein